MGPRIEKGREVARVTKLQTPEKKTKKKEGKKTWQGDKVIRLTRVSRVTRKHANSTRKQTNTKQVAPVDKMRT